MQEEGMQNISLFCDISQDQHFWFTNTASNENADGFLAHLSSCKINFLVRQKGLMYISSKIREIRNKQLIIGNNAVRRDNVLFSDSQSSDVQNVRNLLSVHPISKQLSDISC